MVVYFHIHYIPAPGQVLIVCGNSPETGSWDFSKAPEMIHQGQGNWQLKLEHTTFGTLEYQYHVRENGHVVRSEWGENHLIILADQLEVCSLFDFWQPEPETSYLYTSAFSDSLLSVPENNQSISYEPGHVIIKVFAPLVRKNQRLAISGDTNLFGNWEADKAMTMIPGKFPEWQISLKAESLPSLCNYKFVLTGRETGQIVAWEWGEPRRLFTPEYLENRLQVCSGMTFRYQEAPWKGAGVAIPVFSLRSESSWGCGDFGDLKKMIPWVAVTGQQLIQLLPVNDTTLTGTRKDSYPYNAISIFALHPLYLSPASLSPLHDKQVTEQFEASRQELNNLTEMDYEGVMALKWAYSRALYSQEGKSIMSSAGYQTFFDKNRDWLLPYAAFSYLRIYLNQPDFEKWGQYALYDSHAIESLCKPEQSWHDEVAIHYVVQYLLHCQLLEARNEAHQTGVVLKGDIPIGVNRHGVDVWFEPHLFNRDVQIGAPPDEFSTIGQNWGFPSYNWERMAADDYRWWKRRFSKMADYFDAYRIDHILGFFRIWEIPSSAVQGLLGQFNPSLPYQQKDLLDAGFAFTEDMTEPGFSEKTIQIIFGKKAPDVQKKYVKTAGKNRYKLKAACNSQQKIQALFSDDQDESDRLIRDGLYTLCSEVLFVRDPLQPALLHPRISAQTTSRFQELSPEQQICYNQLYNHFFYYRNIYFWKEKALEKLTPLVHATRMLVCGEDLGMIPSCVPEVMHQLQLLSLEIQRMPKKQGVRFENLNAIPYLSVCTTSTHDMSPIRAWWNEDRETARQFYQQVLWKPGITPEDCTPEIVQDIIQQHLASPAMWVIIPWQDWLGTDALLRRQNPEEERINVPSNHRHYWQYRMHLTIEQLMHSTFLNNTILAMIKRSGR